MLLSRGTKLLQCFAQSTLKRNGIINKQQVRKESDWHGPWVYREPGKPAKTAYITAEVCGAFAIWWILWHCYHDYHHLIGFDLPEHEDFTDTELGIPPDDADC
ncbi:NADH dehydrogenase [ubiquinone] 1 beta subcomplex subunit 2, mitochondrial-like [Leptopilina boulardi]|uniref:NADH dehydrogenase [ubiquinone] 1 beta subcomplex subunit 2, mitochondrial-like n=1 Tax=Leptopilina boulardi TaxID=63433 RepID=UPI0021F63C7A|nr:NADH dehydrogenase [ubiquinone] 1 beta subcomplex subunit 2, mitochondrial-like [Leptopilina boulardi]